MKNLLTEIERVLPDGGQWCDLTKATTLAAIIVGLRPKLVVELGVWRGGSLVPMLLALKHVGTGTAIAIDPWSPAASVIGQNAENSEWWGKVDHEQAYRAFIGRLEVHDLTKICEVWRKGSDECEPPAKIGLLHVDGNHAEQAIRDVKRYAPGVTTGGILVLDDVSWTGGHVSEAHAIAHEFGFRDLYPLGTGVVLQQVS